METKAEVRPAFGEHLAEPSLCLKLDSINHCPVVR